MARTDVLMPDDTDRRPGYDGPDPVPTPPAPALNLPAVAARRWPLLVLGLAFGLVGGFLYHTQQPPAFVSSAQVMVIKKRAEMVGGGADGRTGYVEDYIAPQLTLLKSDRILVAAGRHVRPEDVKGFPWPDDEKARAGVLGGGLTVARDPNAPGGAGGGVLFLSFRAGTAGDSRAMLMAVIAAYQEELSTLYDRATRDRLALLDVQRASLERQEEKAKRGFAEVRGVVRRITEEEFAAVRGRVTTLREKELALEMEVVDLDRQLLAARGAGPDRRQRLGVFQQLTMSRAGAADRRPTLIDPAVEGLEAQRRELATRLGKDHPQLKDIDAKLRFYRELNAKLNPTEGEGIGERNDELWALEQGLAQRRATADDQLRRVRARLQADKATLDALGPHEDKAADLRADAAAAGRQLAAVRQERDQIEATAKQGGYAAEVITEPAPGGQVAPVLPKSLALGAALGLLAGAGLGLLAELADQGFRTPAEIRTRLGVAVLGHLPRVAAPPAGGDPGAGPDASLVVLHRPKSPEAEAYRGVRTQLYFSTQGRGHQVVQVTSPNPGDGKSTLAANLAISIAQSGKRVVLVDCDLRKPRVHKLFKVANWDVGMSTVVAGADDLSAAVRPSGVPHLDLLPCGPRPANPAELLTNPGFLRVLKELRASYDFVVLDTPPMLAVSDPAVVAPRADGVILVLRMTSRARPAAERAREALAAVGANLIGAVVNGVGGPAGGAAGAYRSGYQSGYGYQYDYAYEYVDEYADGPESAITPRPPLKG